MAGPNGAWLAITCCRLTGDPIANIKLLEDPAKNSVVIMKDGKVYKKHRQCGEDQPEGQSKLSPLLLYGG
jgi:hypothetical protein